MNSNMLLFALLSLLCWVSPADTGKISFRFTSQHTKPIKPIRMSMVLEAVDDMYFGCNKTMAKTVNKYFERENENEMFQTAWKTAERCTNRKQKENKALGRHHIQAICVYTSSYKDFYKSFNEHVRNDRSRYRPEPAQTSFPFHFMHFWLTSAIQILSDNMNCHTTYRRTNLHFTAKLNHIVRFGFFASSSFKTTLYRFGKKTCFEIKTCSGAFLGNYSYLGTEEEEVLIPPYELFMVAKGPRVEGLSDCEVVIILQSVGVQSNLNCKAVY
ncbi:T-cell ecto-ADP-ribosyltransferase 1 [Lates calcarifer]|nr:T-cell ecto-ADP-ribosyltransferase 1 [Lates calcarifer]